MRSVMWEYIDESQNRLLELIESDDVTKVISRLPLKTIKNLVFIASGSSNNICRAAKNFLEENTRMNVYTYFPFEFENDQRVIQRLSVESSLVIGISQTGTSSSVLNCLVKAKSLGYKLLTLTEREDTPIKHIGDYYLNFKCGLEACNAKTKGYSASLLLLHLIGVEIARQTEKIDQVTYTLIRNELSELVNKIPDVVEQTIDWVKQNTHWSRAESIVVIGHSSNYGTAIEGALKVSETLCVPALYSDVDEYTHGYHRILFKNSFIIAIEGNGYGSESLHKTFEYIRTITPNRLLISSSVRNNSLNDVIWVSETEHVSSALLSVIVYQVLAVALPELLDNDPNVERHEDYLRSLKTRVEG